jgi:hypothetical protein
LGKNFSFFRFLRKQFENEIPQAYRGLVTQKQLILRESSKNSSLAETSIAPHLKSMPRLCVSTYVVGRMESVGIPPHLQMAAQEGGIPSLFTTGKSRKFFAPWHPPLIWGAHSWLEKLFCTQAIPLFRRYRRWVCTHS